MLLDKILTKTGMIVTGKYQDESTQEILDYIIENGEKLTVDKSSVTIKYKRIKQLNNLLQLQKRL